MIELLVELAPLALAAATSPATIGIVVLILATAKRPLLRASAFVAGFAVLLVALSIAGLLIFRSARSSVDAGSPLFAWIDLGMGVALLTATAISLTRQGAINEERERLRSAPALAFVGFGIAMMLTNLNTLALSVSLLHEIAIAEVSPFERGLALALCDGVILVPLIAPIVLSLLTPEASARVLPLIRRGVDRYGFKVGVVVFTAIGLYLIIEGLTHL